MSYFKFFLFFLIFCALPSFAHSVDLVIIQSTIIQPYERLVKSIKENYPDEFKRFILTEYTGKDLIGDIRDANPSIIVTIGSDALKLAEKNFENLPIISLMIPQTNTFKKNVINIPMILELERQLTIINNFMPKIRSIGIIYSESFLPQILKAKEVANILGVNLITIKIHSNKEVPKALNELKNRIDALWLIPDFDVLIPETTEFFYLFSIENQKPLLTFSSKYVYQGALMSIETDVPSMGKLTVSIIEQIIAGKKPTASMISPRPLVTINGKIAKKMGIIFNKQAIKEAKIIE
ncbi:MAG: hypothetical protein N2202_01830 [Proteobacteria bacterium]|nr:hypothetical protein [Pseudomonadota bacterium]